MDDCAEAESQIQPGLHLRVAGHFRDTDERPRIESHLVVNEGHAEVLHQAKSLCVRTVAGMEEPVVAAVFIRVRCGQFVAKRIFLQKLFRMADADVEIETKIGSRSGDIGTRHNEYVGAGAGVGADRSRELGEGHAR